MIRKFCINSILFFFAFNFCLSLIKFNPSAEARFRPAIVYYVFSYTTVCSMVAIDNTDTSTSMIQVFLSALPSNKIELQIDVASVLGRWELSMK